MALKAKLTRAEYDDLAEGLQGAYVEDGDGYRLDVEPDTGETPPAAADDDRLARLEKMVGALVSRKPEKARPADADLLARVGDLESQLEAERQTARTEKVNAAVSREATRLGVLPGAVEDVIARSAGAGFALQDDGSVSTESGTTIRAYVEGLRKTSAHLFRQPQGSQQQPLLGKRTAPKVTLQADGMNEETLLANLDKLHGGDAEIVDPVN